MPDVNGNLSSSGSSGRGVSLHCQDRLKPSVVASPRTSLPFSDHLPQKVPKKPPSAYYMFYRDYFQQNPEEFKHLSTFGQYSKVIAEKWAKLDEDAKKIYHDNNKLEMQQYKAQMVQYYASQEFKNYQVANHQIEQRIQNIENTSYLNKDSPNRQIADTQYFTESSFDYLENFEDKSVKRISYVNFCRNMYLMESIFDGVLLKEYSRMLKEDSESLPDFEIVQNHLKEKKIENDTLQQHYTNEVNVLRQSINSIANDKRIFSTIFQDISALSFEELKSKSNEELEKLKTELIGKKI